MTEPHRTDEIAESPLPLLTRRAADFDLHELGCLVHRLDTRVSILETQFIEVKNNISETADNVEKLLMLLTEHIRSEAVERIKLLGFVIATLLSILGFAGTVLINHLLQ